MDELAIALQTLAYEKAHLVKEIKVCKEFTEPKVKMVQEQLFEEHGSAIFLFFIYFSTINEVR